MCIRDRCKRLCSERKGAPHSPTPAGSKRRDATGGLLLRAGWPAPSPNRAPAAPTPVRSCMSARARVADNPIVFVTEPWQKMCGFSSQEAIGRNPRLTQGSQSDSSAIMEIAHNVWQQRACKVLVLNFRGGHEANPFWNMLSISPVHHRGQLMLYMVRAARARSPRHRPRARRPRSRRLPASARPRLLRGVRVAWPARVPGQLAGLLVLARQDGLAQPVAVLPLGGFPPAAAVRRRPALRAAAAAG
eukprot:7391414-Prymnesium_polylepis.1